MSDAPNKGVAFLNFLKATASTKQKRISSYGPSDKVLWLGDLPAGRAECRSPFLPDKPAEFSGQWLEVRKTPKPVRPPVPDLVADWVRVDELDQVHKEPSLVPEITVLVEPAQDPYLPQDTQVAVEGIPELRRLMDHPDVFEAWHDYLVHTWEPWADEMRRWQEAKGAYESVDFMRRRLEEAEERYELVLAIGLLQWRDPSGAMVERHILTAPVELVPDIANGRMNAVPAASFERFRIELDMLENNHRPWLDEDALREQLDAIDVQAWDAALVLPVLRHLAHTLRSDARVEMTLQSADRIEERPRLSFAPALILRERRSKAYERMIDKFLEAATAGGLTPTQPWSRLIGEDGDGSPARRGQDPYWLPLPINDEQRQIVQRLASEPCVLVKGPPGTGKSHTIANLICHLLARGDRVLVTAHAPRALAGLPEFLPEDIRKLTLTAVDSLEGSLSTILKRKSEWRGASNAQHGIDHAEHDLQVLEQELARLAAELAASREAETHSHEPAGGYLGTPAQIARGLYGRAEEFDWFPELATHASFPLAPSDVGFLAKAHAYFTADSRAKVMLDIGAMELPSPAEFEARVDRLHAAEDAAQRARREAEAEAIEFFEPLSSERLREMREGAQAIEDVASRAGRVLGELGQTILDDLVVSADGRWVRQVSDSDALLWEAARLLEAIGGIEVRVPDDIDEDILREDIDKRIAHFEQGGRKGFAFLAPAVIRETRHVVDSCRIDGRKPETIVDLRLVRDQLELRGRTRELGQLWGSAWTHTPSGKQDVARAEELTNELKTLLTFFGQRYAQAWGELGEHRAALASAAGRNELMKAIDALLAMRGAKDAVQEHEKLIVALRDAQTDVNAHPCLRTLEEAARGCDLAGWRAGSEQREHAQRDKKLRAHYEDLLGKIGALSPDLAKLLRESGGERIWYDRIRRIEEAWSWAAARSWLRRFSDASSYETRVHEHRRLQQKIEIATAQVASMRAWKGFFGRLDGKAVQSLNAWSEAVGKAGKVTGQQAERNRRAARRHVLECVPSMPAWVMPLHRVWEAVEATPGFFDTVIVDEASQASVDALALMLLAKRIVVIGDEKQIGPEAAVVEERHLDSSVRPDTSLFDYSKRKFATPVILRDHFRCVPEIIRFSNDLSYADAPLIPLRPSPPGSLPALQSRLVPDGECDDSDQGLQNRAEAVALVRTIASLVADKAYAGKSMGVISMEGHAQAELIEALLAERLAPEVIQERRLRCGEPATFQGEHRDVMFLSLVVASHGSHRDHPRPPDERPFNVAMSRARDQVWLFHSVGQKDLERDDLRRRLVAFFETPQNPAQDSRLEDIHRLEPQAAGKRLHGSEPPPYESWFQVDVALDLLQRSFKVRPQVEIASRRVDLIVEGSSAWLAVECDGDEWQGLEQYERDLARQRQLERAGWTFVRVRESDFYVDRRRAIQAIVDACVDIGVEPAELVDQDQPKAPIVRPSPVV